MINVYVEKKYIFLVHTQADFPMYGPVYTLINFELRLMGSRKKKNGVRCYCLTKKILRRI